MFSWKERLYALILRRILGPLLSIESQQKLYTSIQQISVTDGSYIFNDLSFNTEYISSQFLNHIVQIVTATIRTIQIDIRLVEEVNTSSDGTQPPSSSSDSANSSLAWRALKFGINTASNATASIEKDGTATTNQQQPTQQEQQQQQSTVSLVVHVRLEGINIVIEPSTTNESIKNNDDIFEKMEASKSQNDVIAHATTTENKTASYLSSYLEAVLASLRLSMEFHDIRVRLRSSPTSIQKPQRETTESHTTFIDIHTQSITYHDIATNNNDKPASMTSMIDSQPSTSYETIMNKVLDVTRVSVMTGSESDSVSDRIVALLDGSSRTYIRRVEYTADMTCDPNDSTATTSKNPPHTEQDIQVSLHQKLNISFDIISIQVIRTVMNSFLNDSRVDVPARVESVTLQRSSQSSSSMVCANGWIEQNRYDEREATDDADYRTLESIMAQYREARLLVEKKEIRGGILFPSLDDNGHLTFDTFFDANESSSSLQRHSSMLKESLFGSMMHSSNKEHQPSSNWIYQKFTLHLQEGGIKLTFPSVDETIMKQYAAKEYVLLTFNDVDVSSQMSSRSTKYAFSMNHVEIEDAVFVSRDVVDGIDSKQATEVGTMVRFVPDGACDDDDDDDLLVQTPCLSISISIENDATTDTMNVDIIMEPIEISYRHHMISKLISFFQVDANNNPPVLNSPKHSTMSMNVACSSVTLLLPFLVSEDTGPLYDRAGFIAESTMVRESALGFICERIVCEIRKSDGGDKANEMIASCHRIIGFVASPTSRYSAFDSRIHRLDFLLVCGRIEVDPCIPISIRCNHFPRRGTPNETIDTSGTVLAESLFPKVPLLSSYKARQDDDENDTPSKHDDNGSILTNPQSGMLKNLANTDVVVSVNIPEIVVDLSASEIIAIQNMASCFDSQSPPKATIKPAVQDASRLLRTACSVNCDSMRLLLHVENSASCSCPSYDNAAFALSMESFKAYCVMNGSTANHLRVLAHDFDFLEFSNPAQNYVAVESTSAIDRTLLFRVRGSARADSVVNPIIYRTNLFVPISPESPSIHFDFLQESEDNHDSTTTVYINIFHVSYRHNYDCAWIKRLCSFLPPNSTAQKIDTPPSMMRILASAIDCNLDYLPPQKFHTASRLILRIGEIRLSSNFITPRPLKQAFSCSVTDIEILLCCCRFAYNFENGRLISSTEVMKPTDFSMHSLNLPNDATSDDVLRSMNYRTMLTIESITLQVVLSVGERVASDPVISITLSTRQISLFACRDSLARLSDTIGEAVAEMTAMTKNTFEELKSKALKNRPSGTPHTRTSTATPKQNLINKVNAIWPTPSSINADLPREFLLDGYDWTAIDSDEIGKPKIPQGEEQSARWFVDADNHSHASMVNENRAFQNDVQLNTMKVSPIKKVPPIILHHFNLQPAVDPIGDGDMGASKYADSTNALRVQTRVIIRDLGIRLRFFDGYDWPELLNEKARMAPRSECFVLPEVKKKHHGGSSVDNVDSELPFSAEAAYDKKLKLLDDLLIDQGKPGSTFADIPLPEEHAFRMKEQSELRRLARRTSKYFQIEASGVVARLDSIEECDEHRLVSCLNIMINDLFLAESISSDKAVKMLGEWFNEQEHPRDSKEGLLLMKMVTWHPLNRITPDDEVANDESDVSFKIHPLRCVIDQRAVAFIRAFFNSENDHDDIQKLSCLVLPPQLHAVPPPLFTSFRVQPLKMKVDYRPQKLDTTALRNGAVVELINISPLDGMILTLKAVRVENEVGFGSAMSLVVQRWVEDICSTQLHKFITHSLPLDPIAEVGAAATDIVVLPWEAFRNRESVAKALKTGAKSFSKVAMYELLNTSSRVANFVGVNVSRVSEINSTGASLSRHSGGNLLPNRPVPAPRNVLETGPHALESLSRGLQEANYTIVIVPYREYHRSGATGAAYSVMRGIPVAIAAPTSGAAEALSYALLGARNQIRPDIRKEDEATFRGLNPS